MISYIYDAWGNFKKTIFIQCLVAYNNPFVYKGYFHASETVEIISTGFAYSVGVMNNNQDPGSYGRANVGIGRYFCYNPFMKFQFFS